MKYSLVAVALATAVSAQSLSDVPECAIPCLDDAITSETKCETTDLTCVCENFDDVRSAATSCVVEKCGADTALNEVLPATEKLCENPESGSSSSAAESSAAETSAAETSAAETSAAATSTVEATSAVLTTETAVSTISTASFTDVVIAPTPTTPTGSNDTTAAPTSAGTGGATGGAGTSASAVPTGGAAALGSMGGLAMVILGALAL